MNFIAVLLELYLHDASSDYHLRLSKTQSFMTFLEVLGVVFPKHGLHAQRLREVSHVLQVSTLRTPADLVTINEIDKTIQSSKWTSSLRRS
jgi:hypothetical protein